MLPPLHRRQCRHALSVPLFPNAALHCLSVSAAFVASLYACVPPSVRKLPRDDALHIKWRSVATLGVAAAAVGVYPLLFCVNEEDVGAVGVDGGADPHPWYSYLGFSWRPAQDAKIIAHVLALYLGAICCSWLSVCHHARILASYDESRTDSKRGRIAREHNMGSGSKLPLVPGAGHIWQSLKETWIRPTIYSLRAMRDDEGMRWTRLRNLLVAPLAEEVAFRSCLVPPLLASKTASGGSLSPAQVSWIAPLFFGVAHLHHFGERYRALPLAQRTRRNVAQLLLGLVVQFAYTALFGAYASHALARTGSLCGVALAHAVCNYMGLPDVSYLQPRSPLHGYRWCITAAYLVGIALFVLGFDSALFPDESALPTLLRRSE